MTDPENLLEEIREFVTQIKFEGEVCEWHISSLNGVLREFPALVIALENRGVTSTLAPYHKLQAILEIMKSKFEDQERASALG